MPAGVPVVLITTSSPLEHEDDSRVVKNVTRTNARKRFIPFVLNDCVIIVMLGFTILLQCKYALQTQTVKLKLTEPVIYITE